MNPARIAELLQPFLPAPIAVDVPDLCHSEPAQAGEEPAVLSPSQLRHISTYIDILLRWNARINLTAIRDPEDIVTRHFGESLFAASRLFGPGANAQANREGHGFGRVDAEQQPSGASGSAWALNSGREGGTKPLDSSPEEAAFVSPGRRSGVLVKKSNESRRDGTGSHTDSLAPEGTLTNARRATNDRISLADIGSGAGFPGLPIKLWAPTISLTLIESNHKKAAFLREVTRALTLTDVDIQNTRAESLPGESFDIVTLRAVERFESILPIAAALLAPAGRLALLIGASQQNQARSTLPHLTWTEAVPAPRSRARILLIGHRP
jgi:16S rRNA (guanine(527)-N(7))-methyltransferase RsmG